MSVFGLKRKTPLLSVVMVTIGPDVGLGVGVGVGLLGVGVGVAVEAGTRVAV